MSKITATLYVQADDLAAILRLLNAVAKNLMPLVMDEVFSQPTDTGLREIRELAPEGEATMIWQQIP